MPLRTGPIVLNNIFGVCEIVFGFPAVFGGRAVLPPDQVVGLSFLDLVFQDSLNFILFFSVDKFGDWWGEGRTVGFGFFEWGKEGRVEDIVNPPSGWE
jgi:hypothetical protein